MNKISKFTTVATLAACIGPMSAKAEFKGIWMAGGSEQRVVTNYDVGQYAKKYIISDKVKMGLFKSTGEDFEAYEEKLDELADKLYEETLNRMIYQRYIETFASFSQKKGERLYFKTTSREYNDRVQSEIKKYLSKFGGQKNQTEAFGAFLQEQGYPHKQGETSLETYRNWEDELRFKIKEDFRVKNVNNAEYGIALSDYPNKYRNPESDIMAVSNYQDKHRKGWSKIAGQTMSRQDFEVKSRGLNPVVVDAKIVGLTSSVEEIKANGFLAQSAKFISTSFSNKSISGPVEKASEYIELASELSEQKSVEELKESREKELKQYMSGSRRSSLVLARLFDLAIELGQREPKNIAGAQANALDLLSSPLKIEKALKQAAGSLSVTEALTADLNKGDSAEEALLIEIVKNSLEEVINRSDIKVVANLKKSLSVKEYDQVKATVQSDFYAEVLSHFRRGHVYRYAHFLKRNIDGRANESGEEVLSKILP